MVKFYDLKTKLRAVNLYKQRARVVDISRDLKVSPSQILRWVNQYNMHGEAGLSNTNRRVSFEKKCSLVKKVLKKRLSCEQVALTEGYGHSSVARWVSMVVASGSYNSLKPKRHDKTENEGTGDGAGKAASSRGNGTPSGKCPFKKNLLCPSPGKKRGSVDKSIKIAELSKECPLPILLRKAGISRSTYYYHLSHANKDKYRREKSVIRQIFERSRCTYGYRRISIEMHNAGYVINHKTVKKLMSEMGIAAIQKRKKYRSYKGIIGKVADNIIFRDFKANGPGEKMATDISQINVGDKKLYLSAMVDMFNGEVVSYSVSEHPDLNLVMSMMRKALRKKVFSDSCVLHSDQGWHYQHMAYAMLLKSKNIIQSMSRRGNCLDNALMESFFGSLKSELVYLHRYNDKKKFLSDLRWYIRYYNNERIKLRLKTSPVKYRKQFNNLS